jgi:xylulokinase
MWQVSDELVFSYDVGTSSVKTTLVNANGSIVGYAMKEYPIHYPHPGWVEQVPIDYWNAIVATTKQILKETTVNPSNIKGLIFTPQAMGVIPLDVDNNVLYNNITWVDGRAEKQALKFMKFLGGKKIFKKLIGIELSGKDVIPKLMWLKEEKPKIYKKTETILDVGGYLRFKATGVKVFEWSGAGSYAFDLKKKDFDRLLFKLPWVRIDLNKLPPLVRSIDKVGNGLTAEAANELGLLEGTPVFGGCDDTQSAQIGSTAIDEGETHIYLGTSAWLCTATEGAPKFKNGAVTLPSANPEKNEVIGITESAGANLDWALHQLYDVPMEQVLPSDLYQKMDQVTMSIDPGSDHLIFTPWTLGERCPVATTTTRATIFNLSLEHSREHILRAILEGIAYNLRWILENFRKDFNFDPKEIKVIGGGSQSKTWMQILADVLKVNIITISEPKFAGAIGAAMTAFVGLGIHEFSNIKNVLQKTGKYSPNPENFEIYDKLFVDYKHIYASLRKTYRKANAIRFTEVK